MNAVDGHVGALEVKGGLHDGDLLNRTSDTGLSPDRGVRHADLVARSKNTGEVEEVIAHRSAEVGQEKVDELHVDLGNEGKAVSAVAALVGWGAEQSAGQRRPVDLSGTKDTHGLVHDTESRLRLQIHQES